jgi:hypothetical protein
MCLGPSKAEKKAAAEQRVAAESVKQEEIQERAEAKREDISDALSMRTMRKGMRTGGVGRRSLYSGSTGSGFLGRFR